MVEMSACLNFFVFTLWPERSHLEEDGVVFVYIIQQCSLPVSRRDKQSFDGNKGNDMFLFFQSSLSFS